MRVCAAYGRHIVRTKNKVFAPANIELSPARHTLTGIRLKCIRVGANMSHALHIHTHSYSGHSKFHQQQQNIVVVVCVLAIRKNLTNKLCYSNIHVFGILKKNQKFTLGRVQFTKIYSTVFSQCVCSEIN